MRRLARGDRLVLATHNAGKVREIAALLRPFGIETVSAASLGLAEPEEDAPDFAGNARLKAVAAARAAGLPAMADDSGFCVAGLDGAPGVLSARWAGPGRDFVHAMTRVRYELAEGDPRAWFVCALCLAWPDSEEAPVFEGRVDGVVVWPPRGTQGFGYDPIFRPDGGSLTFGEMAPADKETISHRARAFAQLVAACLPTEPAP